jgi:D-3-phosphoglycerate dehydrogenase
MFNIRTFNAIAARGLERFDTAHYAVSADSAEPHGIMLRSHKLAPEEIPASVQAVARAGAGVNNIPLDYCTDRGIVVFNTPGANANSVKELVLTALLLASRDVFGGMQFVNTLAGSTDEAALNKAVEAEKKRFKGRELAGRALGVVGLGAIGSMVARAALDLGMEVLGYDPAISVDAAWRLPSEVQRMENLPALFSRADYVTLHVPLLPETAGMINAESLSVFRPGSVLLNFAREPIVDAAALKSALESGHVGKYVADFPVPGLIGHPNVLLTPHLGASTAEAEENCAVMAANQLVNFLETGSIVNSVNFPTVTLEASSGHRLAIVNRNVPGMLGKMTTLLAQQDINVVDMLNKSRDGIAYNLIDLGAEPDSTLLEAIRSVPDVISVRVIGGA